MDFSNESIFRSSLRKFSHAFFIVLGLLISVFLFMLLISVFSSQGGETDKYNVTLLPNLEDKIEHTALTSPVILRIDIKDVIGQKKLTTENIYNLLIESRKGLLENNRVKAILLHINSPGGSVNDTDGIYRLLQDYKKKYKVPVYTYIDGLCASGGMYIACASDQIYSNPVSIIGSIGVIIGPFFNLFDTLEKIGASSLTLSKGKNKDLLSTFRKWKEGEQKPLNEIISYQYNRFVNIVTSARPKINKSTLVNEYGANVFDSLTAEKIGLIDHGISNYKTALKALITKANIDLTKPYQVVELTPKQTLVHYLTDPNAFWKNGEVTHKITIGSYDLSNFNHKFSYLYAPELEMK